MAFTVVGFTKYEPTSGAGPVTFSIPVPTGTQVGDLLFVGTWGASWMSVPDTRLTEVDNPNGYPGGAYGVATDLSDVQVTSSQTTGNDDPVIVMAFRDFGTVVSAQAVGLSTRTAGDELIFGADSTHFAAAAVVMNFDIGYPGGGSGWTTQGTATSGNVYAQAYTAFDSAGVPALSMAAITGAPTIGAAWLIFDTAPPAARYLRQRQSPRRTPSRVRGVDLRARQTPLIR